MKKNTDIALSFLSQQLDNARKQYAAVCKEVQELEKNVEKRKLELFRESKVLKKIGWVIRINEESNNLYLIPDQEKEREWLESFFDAYSSEWNHYRIELENCSVVVNDYDIHISFGKIDPVTAIKALDLKIVKSEVSEKKKEMEEKIKKLTEVEKYLETLNPTNNDKV